jgi:hypothetical protein
MTIGDFAVPLRKLLEDATAAEEYLEQQDSQFARRAYIRSVFAYVEGTVWLIKQTCLRAVVESKVSALSLPEQALLADVVYDLKSNGEPYEQQKFLRLPDNLRFAVRVVNRLCHSSVDLEVGSVRWERFLKVLDTRHQITHPKNATGIDVADEEIKLAIEACGWFNETMQKIYQAFEDSGKQHGPGS